jgi:enoyl-CoA hydratase
MADLVEVVRAGELAIVRMQGGKANALGAAMLDALRRAFDQVEASDAAGVVVTGTGNAFCAGLALPELIALDRPAMAAHIATFEAVMRRILTCRLATVAAINGHAIAGGCVIALMCDVRIMAATTAKIGLNEVQLGIGLPALVIEPLRIRVPAHAVAIALAGRLHDPDTAAAIGLIDAVTDPTSLADAACTRAAELARSPVAYAQIKAAILRPVLAAIDAHAEAERAAWLDTWFSDHAQRTLRAAVERITHRG